MFTNPLGQYLSKGNFKTRSNMRTGAFLVSFTKRGEMVRDELLQIHNAVAAADSDTDEMRQNAILEIFFYGSDAPGDFFM